MSKHRVDTFDSMILLRRNRKKSILSILDIFKRRAWTLSFAEASGGLCGGVARGDSVNFSQPRSQALSSRLSFSVASGFVPVLRANRIKEGDY